VQLNSVIPGEAISELCSVDRHGCECW